MQNLSKNDIKEIFTEALEPFANAIKEDFNGVNGRLDKIEGRLDKVEGRLDKIDGRLDNVEADVKWMKDNSNALFTNLDKLIKLYEDQKQEILMLGIQIKRLENRVAQLESGR